MQQILQAKEMPLHKVFSDDYLFTIPVVQRPYSWTINEASDLLGDLVNYIEHHGITEDNVSKIEEPYFLGSIVLVQKEKNQFEVLDGQQRLTTLTILFATIRDVLGQKEVSEMIMQKGNRITQTKDENRIELRNRDQAFFNKYIQQEGGTEELRPDSTVKTDSQRYILENALYFREQLKLLPSQIVETLPTVLALQCYLVIVSTKNFDSAFRIFTVLNDRGLDLLESDIFKARVIGDINDEEQDVYTAKWEDIEVALGREKFKKLFDHIRMILQKKKFGTNLKEEYEEIFKRITGKEFIENVLIPYSDIYMELADYTLYFKNQPKLVKLLSLMEKIDNVDWVTPAMYFMHRGRKNLYEFLKALEALAAGGMVLRYNYNWRTIRYLNLLKEIERDVDIFKEGSSLYLSKEEKVKIIDALNGDVYLDLKDTAKRYILLKLDSLLTTGQPHYNYAVITVEHVLPQNPSTKSEWLVDFKNPEEYTHKLGNLVLLTRKKNSQAKNFDFNKKKMDYFKSSNGVTSFALTSQVVQEVMWTPDVINRRQQQLVQLLIKDWQL